MNSIIKKLYYGTLNPDNNVLKEGNEYEKINEQIVKLLEEIKNETDEKIFKKITEVMELYMDSNNLENENAFLHGFKCGANLLLEILAD